MVVVIATGRAQLALSGSFQTFTADMGGTVPKLALFRVSGSTLVGTRAPGAVLAFGATDGVTDATIGIGSRDNNSSAQELMGAQFGAPGNVDNTDGQVIRSHDSQSPFQYTGGPESFWDSFSADSVRVAIDRFPTEAVWVDYILLGGAEFEVDIQNIQGSGAAGTSTDHTALGEPADAVICWRGQLTIPSVGSSIVHMYEGFWSRSAHSDNPGVHVATTWSTELGVLAHARADVRDDSISSHILWGAGGRPPIERLGVSEHASGFTLDRIDSVSSGIDAIFIAMSFGGQKVAYAGTALTPTTAAPVVQDLETPLLTADLFMGSLSRRTILNADGTGDSPDAGSSDSSVHAAFAGTPGVNSGNCSTVHYEHGPLPTNTGSLSDDRIFNLLNPDGSSTAGAVRATLGIPLPGKGLRLHYQATDTVDAHRFAFLVIGDTQTLVPEEVRLRVAPTRNLLPGTADFAGWAEFDTILTTLNDVVDPLGGTTGIRLGDRAAGNQASKSFDTGVADGMVDERVHRWSISIREIDSLRPGFRVTQFGGSADVVVDFTWSTLLCSVVVVNAPTGMTPVGSCASEGNGWYRLSLAMKFSVADSATIRFAVIPDRENSSQLDNHFWGPTLEIANSQNPLDDHDYSVLGPVEGIIVTILPTPVVLALAPVAIEILGPTVQTPTPVVLALVATQPFTGHVFPTPVALSITALLPIVIIPAGPAAILPTSGDVAFEGIFDLLPRGLLWRRDSTTELAKAIRGWAEEWGRIDDRAVDVTAEAFTRTATELLSEWEVWLGVEEDCGGLEDTLQERRFAVFSKATRTGGQSLYHFSQLAQSLGYLVDVEDITEVQEFAVGRSAVGDPLSNGGEAFVWTVHAPEATPRFARASSSTTQEPLTTFGNTLLTCAFNRDKPAHTFVVYVFDKKWTGYAPWTTIYPNPVVLDLAPQQVSRSTT